jgi:uncharacterized protein with PIN domain
MLGGLARTLRALGHVAAFEDGIDDAALVARAEGTGEWILSSDRPLFERRAFNAGRVRGLFVPRHAPIEAQAIFVLRTLGLVVGELRCLACGAALSTIDKAKVAGRVPAGAYAAFDEYFRCPGCDRVYWKGTHHGRIEAMRARVAAALAEG